MPAENADYIHQLNPDKPTGGESISEGDDHLRAIKKSVTGTFKEVKGPVTSTHTELNAVGKTATDLTALTAVVESLGGDVGDIDTNSHGNVASCYYNPINGGGTAGLVYTHNVADVIVNPTDPSGMQTRIMFADGTMDGDPHYAFNLTPVNGTGNATNITVVGVAPDHLSFLSWHLVGGTWTPLPATEVGFSLMINDMDKSQ